jgi:hypothetical protein
MELALRIVKLFANHLMGVGNRFCSTFMKKRKAKPRDRHSLDKKKERKL